MRKFVVAASKRSQMQRRKRVTASSEYHRGDIVEFDGNARGINPRIGQARILNVRPGLGGHGNTNPDPVYDVEDVESGRRFTIDHFQIQRVVGSQTAKRGRYIKSDEEIYDDIQEISQEFTSENTSINSTKLPAIFNMVHFEPGTINIDYGGGKFDNVADYLTQYDVINLVYDPYNRSAEHNQEVIRTVRKAGGADTATCSNVLNVIKEPEVRQNVLRNMSKLVKPGGTVYFTVYEGTGKGNEGPTKSGYQLNRKTKDYMEEIQQVFPDAKRKGKLITATNGGSVAASTSVKRFKVTASKINANTGVGLDLNEVKRIFDTLPDQIASTSDITGPSRMIDADHFMVFESDVGSLLVYIDETGSVRIEDADSPNYELCALCKSIQEVKDYVRRMSGSYSQRQDEYAGRYSANASTRVNAAYGMPERSLEPLEYDEPAEVEDSQDQVEFEFDCDILLSEESWDYADQSYDFATGNGSRGDWYGAETGVYLGDKTSMVEYLDELLESRLPAKPGVYHISGVANLIFDISGIYMYSDFQGRDEDDSPIIDETYDTESADADFNFGASYIDGFRCEFISDSF